MTEQNLPVRRTEVEKLTESGVVQRQWHVIELVGIHSRLSEKLKEQKLYCIENIKGRWFPYKINSSIQFDHTQRPSPRFVQVPERNFVAFEDKGDAMIFRLAFGGQALPQDDS